MTNPLIETFQRDVKEFDETIAPLTESTADIKAFIYNFTLNLVTKMIEECEGRKKVLDAEAMKSYSDLEYGRVYGDVQGRNSALTATISQLEELKEYLLKKI